MSIIDKVNSSNDIKKLSVPELYELCDELRNFEIENISKTGGHLASNMGTVELTVAIHRVYDTAKDRVVFDVGHQSYAHKIITGRRDAFHTLRQFGGISGFPKPYESDDDAFIAGHASNSISVALGMARARTLNNEDYDVACVIGDGALTGGLAFEGISDAGAGREPIVIILNDNNMSINENVGAVAGLLQNIRIRPGYISLKKKFRLISKKLPHVYSFAHNFKEWLKSWLLPSNIFSDLGLCYLGPVDGHNVEQLESALRLAKDMECPVILHVLTKKGKGCAYAEAHPDKYHGVGSFDPVTGELLSSGACFAEKMGEALCSYAREDERIVAITAAMSGGTGTECFAEQFPQRFFDIGIAEGHAAAMAAGMAKQGLIPVFAVYSSFLQRSFDMLIHDISLQKLHAVFAVDRAGLVGNDGETHHGVFDVSYLGTVPNMSILCPASFGELYAMLGIALHDIDGAVAVRYPRGGEGRYTDVHTEAETVIREGGDVTLVCYGTMINEMLEAADILSDRGVSAEIIKLGRIKPNDFSMCIASVAKTGRILVAEEVCASGSIGTQIMSALVLGGIAPSEARRLDLGSGIVTHGSVRELLKQCKLDAESIADAAYEMCRPAEERK